MLLLWSSFPSLSIVSLTHIRFMNLQYSLSRTLVSCWLTECNQFQDASYRILTLQSSRKLCFTWATHMPSYGESRLEAGFSCSFMLLVVDQSNIYTSGDSKRQSCSFPPSLSINTNLCTVLLPKSLCLLVSVQPVHAIIVAWLHSYSTRLFGLPSVRRVSNKDEESFKRAGWTAGDICVTWIEEIETERQRETETETEKR